MASDVWIINHSLSLSSVSPSFIILHLHGFASLEEKEKEIPVNHTQSLAMRTVAKQGTGEEMMMMMMMMMMMNWSE